VREVLHDAMHGATKGISMRIRELRPGDKEYLATHFRRDVADFVAAWDKDVWESVGLENMDHVLVIEDGQGNCGSMMLIKQLEEDEEDTAFSWLIPGDHLEKSPIAFLRLTRRELCWRLLNAGPYRMVWSYVRSDEPRSIAWAVRWLGGEIVARDLILEGRDTPMHKVVLSRDMLQKRDECVKQNQGQGRG
jgi:hypothetical protein